MLSAGRTSRFYRGLVRDRQVAVTAQARGGFPGNRYPNLFFISAVPARGHSTDEVQTALRAELERLKNEDVSDDELARVKTREKAGLIRTLAANQGLASNLAHYQAMFGDWRELFRDVDRIDKVTKADIRRVASKTFVDTNRTVGILETTPARSSMTPAATAPSGDEPAPRVAAVQADLPWGPGAQAAIHLVPGPWDCMSNSLPVQSQAKESRR